MSPAVARARRLGLLSLFAGLAGCGELLGLGEFGAEPGRAADAAAGSGGGAGETGSGCGGGEVPCGAEACVDLRSDSRHCGKCERSCQGGACREGKCQPLILARDGPHEPRRLVRAGAYVYWSTAAGRLARVPALGGLVETLASDPEGMGDITVDDVAAHWATPTAVRRVDLATGAVDTRVGDALVGALARDAGALYFLHPGSAPTGGGLYRVDPDAASPGATRVWPLERPAAMGLHGSFAYCRLDGAPHDRLEQIAKNGAEATVLLASHAAADGAEELVADGDALYWIAFDAVYSRSFDSGAVGLVVEGEGLTALAAESKSTGRLYVGDERGRLRRAGKVDHQTALLFADGAAIVDLALDDHALYWVNAAGEVKRLVD